jgi:hypothetical protein
LFDGGGPLQRRTGNLEVSSRRRRRPDRPSWSWADLRSTLAATYRSVRFSDPPSASRRPLGSSIAAPASADCSTYSPRFRGLRLSSRVSPEVACRAHSLRSSHSAPLLGFSALQHMPGPRVHLHGVSTPRYVPPSGFLPSRRLPPREPSRPCFRPERSWASPFRGLLLTGPSAPLSRPVTPTTLAARRLRTSRRPGTRLSVARSASPSSGLPVPGVRSPGRLFAGVPRALPLLGFSLPEAFRHPPCRPDPAAIPPGLSSDLRACAPQSPRPPGVLTASGLAQLREPGGPSEVLSPF